MLVPPQPTLRRGQRRDHPARGPAGAARRARLAARPDGDRHARRRPAAAARRVRASAASATRRATARSRRCSADAEPRCGRRRRSGSACSATRRRCRRCSRALNGDASPLVRGRAAEALGLIGDASAAAPIGAYRHRPHRRRRARQRPRRRAGLAARAGGRSLPPRHLRAGPAEGARRAAAGDPRRRRPAAQRLVADRLRAAPHRRSADAGAAAAPAQGRRRSTAPRSPRRASACRSSRRSPCRRCSTCWRRRRRAPAVRLQAVRGLGRLGDERAVAPLLALLDEPTLDPTLQVEVVDRARRAQGGAGDRSAARSARRPLADDAGGGRDGARRDRRAGVPRRCCRASIPIRTGRCGPRVVDRARHARRRACPKRRGSRISTTPTARTWPATLKALGAAKTPRPRRRWSACCARASPARTSIVRATAAEILGETKPADAAAVAGRGVAGVEGGRRHRRPRRDPRGAGRAQGRRREDAADRGAGRSRLGGAAEGAGDAAHARSRRPPPSRERPAPTRLDLPDYAALGAPTVSPHAYIDTVEGHDRDRAGGRSTRRSPPHNFATLAERGFFNGLRIHRVVPDFVVQDGDPRGDGNGGPGYSIRDELNDLPYLRGHGRAWRCRGPDTGGSQWFITHSPQPHLDAKYTVFGHVVAGMDVVDKLTAGRHDRSHPRLGRHAAA